MKYLLKLAIIILFLSFILSLRQYNVLEFFFNNQSWTLVFKLILKKSVLAQQPNTAPSLM